MLTSETNPMFCPISEGEAKALLNTYWGPGRPPANHQWSVYEGEDAGELAYDAQADLIFCFSGTIALLGMLDAAYIEPVQLPLFSEVQP